jgi:hypothetical protein
MSMLASMLPPRGDAPPPEGVSPGGRKLVICNELCLMHELKRSSREHMRAQSVSTNEHMDHSEPEQSKTEETQTNIGYPEPQQASTRRLLTLGCQWHEGGWCMPTLFLSPMPLWCCGLRCPWGWQSTAAACFLGVCDCSGCPHSRAARVGRSSASAVAPVVG